MIQEERIHDPSLNASRYWVDCPPLSLFPHPVTVPLLMNPSIRTCTTISLPSAHYRSSTQLLHWKCSGFMFGLADDRFFAGAYIA